MMQKKIPGVKVFKIEDFLKGGSNKIISNIPTIFHETIEVAQNRYAFYAKCRFRDSFEDYKKCFGNTVKYYREKSKIPMSDLVRYLGVTRQKYGNFENATNGQNIDFMFLDEFCAIVGVDFGEFYKKFRNDWKNFYEG